MTAPKPYHNNAVLSVVITYIPSQEVDALIATLSGNTPVLVVDNTPPGYRQMPLSRGRVNVLRNGANLGLARALNLSMEWAKERQYQWLLVFDQDSRIQDDSVANLTGVLSNLGSNIAVVGANYWTSLHGIRRPRFTWPPGAGLQEAPAVITSGTLFRVGPQQEIGPFREPFFVDHVDHEYCLRARKRGFRVVLNPNPCFDHSIGPSSDHEIFGLHVCTPNHNALRRYLWHRNAMTLLREYFRTEPGWCLRLAGFYLPMGLLTMVLFEPNRRVKLTYALRGIWDGLRGRHSIDPNQQN